MTTTTVAAPPTVADLILVRLAVPSKKPPSATEAREAVESLTGRPLPAEEFGRLTDELRTAGLVEPRPKTRGGVQLTRAGRTQALELLGVSEWPPRTNWQAVAAKYLMPRALGVSPDEMANLSNTDRLAAFLIRREHGVTAGRTVKSALEAVVCKQLGRGDQSSLKDVKRDILCDLLGSDEKLSPKEIEKQFPRKLLGTKQGRMLDYRKAVIGRWLSGPQPRTPDAKAVEMSLPEFASTVLTLARHATAGRFGDDKVFVSAVWRQSQAEDNFPRLTLDQFKARLLEAHRERLLTLSRADLVEVMDPAVVRESEITFLGASFHFILLEDRS